MEDQNTYEIQPGQQEVVADIIQMLNEVNATVKQSDNTGELLQSLGALSAVAVIAASLLKKVGI